jgi:DNA polymerase zeta
VEQSSPGDPKSSDGKTRAFKKRRTGSPFDAGDCSSPYTKTYIPAPPSIQTTRAAAPTLTAVYASHSLPPSRSTSTNCFIYLPLPPSASELLANIGTYGIPNKIYRDPYYSKEIDAPEKPREYAGLLYYLKGGEGIRVLQDWDCPSFSKAPGNCFDLSPKSISPANIYGWEFASCAPSVTESKKWLMSDAGKVVPNKERSRKRSQVSLLALGNSHALKLSNRSKAQLKSTSTG